MRPCSEGRGGDDCPALSGRAAADVQYDVNRVNNEILECDGGPAGGMTAAVAGSGDISEYGICIGDGAPLGAARRPSPSSATSAWISVGAHGRPAFGIGLGGVGVQLVCLQLSVSTGGSTPSGCGRRAFDSAARSAWAPRPVAVGVELIKLPA